MKKVALSIAFATFAAPAFAEDSGFYLGADAGFSRTRDNNVTTINTPNAATSRTKGIVGIYGGYQFTPNWGIEAKFTGAGENRATNPANGNVLNAKSDAFSLTAVGTLPLSDSFSLYGKLGYARTKTSVTSTVPTITGTRHGSVTYGLGGQYNVSKTMGIRFGYDAYNSAIMDNTAGSRTFGKNTYHSSVYTVGAVFKL